MGNLKTAEIIQEQPIVSICIQTYQHVNYIGQCLDGILMQQTNFKYEIILGEDESSDGTREVCIEYARRYPDKIRLFLRSRKDVIYLDGRPTGRFNYIENLKAAAGKYIALCEGDDYWTDPLKLQKQVQFLEENPDFVLSFHNSLVVYEDGRPSHLLHEPNQKEVLELKDIIHGPFLGTLSVVFRNRLVKKLPEWFWKVKYADAPLFSMVAAHGKIKYFDEIMGVYRKHAGGAMQSLKDDKFKLAAIEAHEYMNQYFNNRYRSILIPLISDFYYFLSEQNALNNEPYIAKEYIKKSILKRMKLFMLPQKRQVYILLRLTFPSFIYWKNA